MSYLDWLKYFSSLTINYIFASNCIWNHVLILSCTCHFNSIISARCVIVIAITFQLLKFTLSIAKHYFFLCNLIVKSKNWTYKNLHKMILSITITCLLRYFILFPWIFDTISNLFITINCNNTFSSDRNCLCIRTVLSMISN